MLDPRTAATRRAHTDRALALGIDEAFINEMVESFYGRVRRHPNLGPVFDAVIGNDWEAHLVTMKNFWNALTFYNGRYKGKPVPAHRAVPGIEPEHFSTWLEIWRDTLEDISPDPAVAEYYTGRAGNMARSLQQNIFKQPDKGQSPGA